MTLSLSLFIFYIHVNHISYITPHVLLSFFRLLNCSSKMDIYLSCFQLPSGCRITVHRTFSIGYHFNSDNAMCTMKANDLSFSAKTVVPYFWEGWGRGTIFEKLAFSIHRIRREDNFICVYSFASFAIFIS